jgi:NADH/NAD ratio-sensing transcriptional regulator Rex
MYRISASSSEGSWRFAETAISVPEVIQVQDIWMLSELGKICVLFI